MFPATKHSLFRVLTLAAVLCAAVPAQTTKGSAKPVAPAPKPSMNGAKVVEMLKKGLPQDLILTTIRGAGSKVPFTADDLIAMKDLGAGDDLFIALGAAPPVKIVKSSIDSLPQIPRPARKRVVAVEAFDFKGVATQSQKLFGPQSTIPDAIATMMMHRMTASKEFLMVERPKLEAIQKEIDKAQTIQIRRGSGPRMGKLLGAEAILVGEVTQLSYETTYAGKVGKIAENATRVYCGLFSLGCNKVKEVAFREKTVTAQVKVNYRLLDVETGTSLHTGESLGTAARVSREFQGREGQAAGSSSTIITDIHETILAEAVTKSLDQLGAGIATAAPKLETRELEIEARVADFTPSKMTITAGQFAAVTMGDRFSVERITGEVKDPATGKVLGLSSEKVGEMVVTNAREQYSEGPWIGSLQKGAHYLVRLLPPVVMMNSGKTESAAAGGVRSAFALSSTL